jgi:leucyl aminopeptidase (aminopeptidase T)
VNVYIGLPPVEDPALFDSLPPARMALVNKAYADLPAALNAAPLRGLFIAYPSRHEAERVRMDSAAYATMHWNAVATDYAQIAQTARELGTLLGSARLVRVTAPGGTDLTFALGGRKVFREDGVVTAEDARSGAIMERTESLPGGAVYLAPVETSANGRVAVARDLCRGQPVAGVTFDLKNGQMQNLKAARGAECITSVLAPYEGPKDRFGSFGIGLNPALAVVEANGAEYRPGSAAGMVTIGVGANEFLGGENKVQGGYSFALPRATVTVDGKVVVRDGRLVRQTASVVPLAPTR